MFSVSEHKLLKILGNKKMTIAELTEEFYSDSVPPLKANNKVAQLIRSISEKCDYYDVCFRIEGEGKGRGGRTVWKVKT